MNRLPAERRAQIIGLLAEGNSLRATSRLADVAINTVTKLLLDVGAACERYQDEALRGLKCKRIQCDEIWAFVYAKARNLPEKYAGDFGYGDVWTWTAIDTDSKLVSSWAVGGRDGLTAQAFISDLAARLATQVQLTADGQKVYLEAIEGAFGSAIDYAMLVKMYEGDSGSQFAERQNLTMRMGMRRFARLTNAFSKQVDSHKAAVALHFMHHNFARIHKTLRVTPAMEAGVANHVWSLDEIARLAT